VSLNAQLELFGGVDPAGDGFFNTTHLDGDARREARRRVRGQQLDVLQFFERHPEDRFAPEDVLDALYAGQTSAPPLTSVRRAITNLTAAKYLEKTDDWAVSRYGARTHTWRLAPGWRSRVEGVIGTEGNEGNEG
jgi:hypothetical protein